MKKLTIAIGTVALLSGGMMLPTLGQNAGRTIVRETLMDSGDFIKAGRHLINKAHIAYISSRDGRTEVYFVHGVPPLFLNGEEAKALVVQLNPQSDPEAKRRPVRPGQLSPDELTDPQGPELAPIESNPLLSLPQSTPTRPSTKGFRQSPTPSNPGPQDSGPPPYPKDPPVVPQSTH
ncbi:hypothetical protein TA3x_001980 [Tundrisphaera sp. TA3]|uniref:hypothetical protein n=1 Tax=Tundrisphaera sp. TA3 TaxID=3435775 RepID=UPI003EBB0D80